MSKESDLIKSIVRIDETALLNRYLKSRGINPGFVSKDQKVAHSKTNQFKVWMRAHVNDPVTEAITTEPSPTQKRLRVLKTSLNKHKEVRVADGEKILHTEAVDKKDTITFDIPLLIRVLEFAREDLKSDIHLHKMVERLLSIRGKGTLTMNQYGQIIKEEVADEKGRDILARHAAAHAELMDTYKIKDKQQHRAAHAAASEKLNKIKSEYAKHSASKPRQGSAIAQDYKDQESKRGVGHVRDHVEVSGQPLEETSKEKANEYMWSAKSDRQRTDDQINKEVEKQGSGWSKRRHNKISKLLNRSTKRTTGINRALDRLNKEETELDEAKEANYGGDYQQSVLAVKAKAEKKPVDMKSLAARMQASYAKDKKSVKENTLDPQAATQAPCDCANNPDDTVPAKRSTAQKVKLLLGAKKQVKEEMYDSEKEDKSTAPVGKKVKLQKPGVDSITKEAPKAAAVLTGGKTMTGETRDTIEFDPMMKMRKQSPNSQKSV